MRTPKLLAALLSGALTLSGMAPLPAAAASTEVTTRYAVSLMGLSVGQATFTTSVDGNAYSVSGNLSSAGLANLFSPTSGTSSSSGRIRNGRLEADRYRLNYTSDGKKWSSDIRMRRGTVRQTTIAPKLRKDLPKDYVPVTKGQLAGVVDPLAGLVFRAPVDPAKVCNRTVSFFDGWSRLDLKLSPAGTEPFRASGWTGNTAVCDVRVVPVGGYRKGSSGLRYIQSQTIRIWFARLGDTDLVAPVKVRIPTKVGTLMLTAASIADA